MNAKKAKLIRKVLAKKVGINWREAKYADSDHPREKPHQKQYPLNIKKFTKAGAKNIVKYVPFKVGTLILKDCGKLAYRHYKEIGKRI